MLSAGFVVASLKFTVEASPVAFKKLGFAYPEELSCTNKLVVGPASLNELISAKFKPANLPIKLFALGVLKCKLKSEVTV
jgi:hypothetical protein